MKRLLAYALFLFALSTWANPPLPPRGCVDGDSDKVFSCPNAIPALTTSLPLTPKVIYNENGDPVSVQWQSAKDERVITTLIGRYYGHEIVDISYFPSAPGPSANQFITKILVYRNEANVSAPLQPFFILRADNVRNYEQVFESAKDDPYSLVVSKTIPGNGVMWTTYTFRFDANGVSLISITAGGRRQSTTTATFKGDGTLVDIREEKEN